MATPEIHGHCEPGFEAVRDAFARCFTDLGETGAAACAYVDGRPVADLWSGVADSAASHQWREDTLVHVYSVTKPFAAVCLLMLVGRGLVDLDAPVARYWPEFAQAGKEHIPVRWLLTHQAGLLGLRELQPREAIFDWDRICRLLAAEAPWWEPGTRHGEHAIFFGHLVGEVVRRVDGRSLGEFLREEVCAPWGLDFHVGLTPAEEQRCATLAGIDEAWRQGLITGRESLHERAINNPPAGLHSEVVNGSEWRRAEVPAVNGHGTAHSIARFYAAMANGGELGGVRLLPEALAVEATSAQVYGEDVFLEREVSWGLGFQIDTDGFGLGGLGGALGWGNREHRFGFGYVTRQMATHDRALLVYGAAAAAAGFEPVVE